MQINRKIRGDAVSAVPFSRDKGGMRIRGNFRIIPALEGDGDVVASGVEQYEFDEVHLDPTEALWYIFERLFDVDNAILNELPHDSDELQDSVGVFQNFSAAFTKVVDLPPFYIPAKFE